MPESYNKKALSFDTDTAHRIRLVLPRSRPMEGNIRLDHNDDFRPYEQSGMEQVVNTNDDDFQIVNDRNTIPGEQPETDEEHTAVKESNFET